MTGAFAVVVIVAALLVAATTGLWAYLDKPVPKWQLAATAVIELVVIALAITAIVQLIQGHDTESLPTVLGYLFGLVILLPLGLALAIFERTKWGAAGLAIAALIVPVVLVRLQHLWEIGGV